MPVVIQLNRQTAGSDFCVPVKPSADTYGEPCDAPLSPITAPVMTAPQFLNGRRLPTSFFGALADAEVPSAMYNDDSATVRYTHNPYGYGLRVIGQTEEPPAQSFYPAGTRDTNTVIYALDVAAGMPDSPFVPADSIMAATSSPMSFMSTTVERFWEECHANSSQVSADTPDPNVVAPPFVSKVPIIPSALPVPVYPVRHCIFSVATHQDGSEEQDYNLVAQYTSLAPVQEATGLIGHAAISGCTVYTYVSVNDGIKDIPSCLPPHWKATPTAKLEAEDGPIAEVIAAAPFQNQSQEPPSTFKLATSAVDPSADQAERSLKEARMVQRYSNSGGSSYLPANVRTRHIVTCLGGNNKTARIAYMNKRSVTVVPSGLTTVHVNNHFSQSNNPFRDQVTSPITGDAGTDNETPVGRGTSPNGVSLANCTKLAYHEAKARAALREGSVSPFPFSAPQTPGAGTPAGHHMSPMFGTPTMVSAY